MHRRRLAPTFLTPALVLALVAGACGSGTADDTTTPTASPTTSVTTPTPTPSAAPTTPAPTPTPTPTTPAPTPTPSEQLATPNDVPTTPSEQPPAPNAQPTPPPAPALPGEPFDYGPMAGDVLAVMGVQHDDRLNLRAGPGTDQEILARLAPTEDHIVAQGHARVRTHLWYEVEAAGTVGWVSARYVAYLGPVDDITSRVVSQLGTTPSATTMAALGLTVAHTQASEGEVVSRITMVVAADETGDLGEVTYDVVGLPDDTLWGFRLHVFGTPSSSGFTLKSVEQTELCARGVSDSGLCR